MTENAFFWILGIAATAIAAIGGALWKHVLEDAKVRERLSSLESDNTTTKAEVKSIRERLHDIRDDLTREIHQKLKDWQADLKQWVKEQLGK